MWRPSLLRPAATTMRRLGGRGTVPLLTTTRVGGDGFEVGNVALLKMDDQKMNAFSFEMISEMHAALDAAAGAGAVVLTGNAKCFSAGFDLSIMGQAAKGPSKEASDLLREGGELVHRLLELPQPLIMAVPGHSLALGAILLLTADLRIGVAKTPKCKIGTNEVHIGLPLPAFAVELARTRLSPRHLTRATTLGNVYDPEGAVEAGYLDMVVPAEELESRAVAMASQLAHLGAQGAQGAFFTTKLYERRDLLKRARELLEADCAAFCP
jgi:enoyl-CoA hydratase